MFVVTSPLMAKMASLQARSTPQEAWARAVRRGKILARGQWSNGWGPRLVLVAEAPLVTLAVAWFGLGTLLVTGWHRLRGNP
jgi:hypothetical protein